MPELPIHRIVRHLQMKWKNEALGKAICEILELKYNEIIAVELNSITKIEIIYDEKRSIITLCADDTIYEKYEMATKEVKDLSDFVHFTNLNTLLIYDRKDDSLDFCNEMPQLTELLWKGGISQKQLREISQLRYIENLELPFQDLDYSILSKMVNLEMLKLNNSGSTSPSDRQSLLTLPSEKILIDLENISCTDYSYELTRTHPNICNIDWIVVPTNGDVQFLKNMNYLEKLDIRNVADITSISEMIWLKELKINAAKEISDFTSLSKLVNLERLSLTTDIDEDFSLNNIGELKSLEELKIYGNYISSLDGIECFSGLKSFSCRYALVEDISEVSELSIEYLDLTGNIITDISALQSLGGLQVLRLANNEIEEIVPLQMCTNLQYLDLSENRVYDISLLAGLPLLEELMLDIPKDEYEKIDLNQWYNVLLSLPNLKYYSGPDVGQWLSENMPHVSPKTVYNGRQY